MHILFCNNSFPGQFEALARCVAARPEHTVLFASSYGRRDFSIAGVRRVLLKASHERAPKGKDECLRQWAQAVAVGREARGAFAQLKRSGFEPDMALFTAGCGESLFLKEVFPASFRVAYLDLDRYAAENGQDEEKSVSAFLTRGLALFHGHAVFALSGDERGIPAFLRPVVGMVPPSVDTDFFRPENAGLFGCDGFALSRETELVAIDMEGLSETAALPAARLLRERPKCHVLLVGRDRAGMDLGAFAEPARACPGRLHVQGMSGRTEYRDMLAASTVYVAPSPHSRVRELLEAVSCGALLLARPSAAPGTEALMPGKTMLTWPDSAEDQLRLLHHALDDRATRETLCRNGQEAVWTHHAQKIILPRHVAELLNAYERWKGSA